MKQVVMKNSGENLPQERHAQIDLLDWKEMKYAEEEITSRAKNAIARREAGLPFPKINSIWFDLMNEWSE